MISIIYVLYNSILTSMIVSSEFVGYGARRKPLRRSSPSGMQRNTYWLSLPHRYSLPFMTAFALLHFLVSEGYYMVRILEFGPGVSGGDIPLLEPACDSCEVTWSDWAGCLCAWLFEYQRGVQFPETRDSPISLRPIGVRRVIFRSGGPLVQS